MDRQLEQLAQFVANANSVEGLTRPLLGLLQQITGLESTYLTSIDEQAGWQRVDIVHNTGQLQLPEGLTVPWHDTLCKRALKSQCFVTENVAEVWGDSEAAKQLGIKTYISVPICSNTGELRGTLCGASTRHHGLSLQPELMQLIQLCADLISHQLNRESASAAAHARAEAAEYQLERVQLLATVSELCVAAQSLSLAVTQIASVMQQSGYWQQVLPFEMQQQEFIALAAGGQIWQQLLPPWLACASTARLEHHVVALSAATRPAQAQDNNGVLVNIYVDEQVVAALLVLDAKDLTVADNKLLLLSISNALSLLAARLDEHQQLVALNQQFSYFALHDPLTGLPNRRYLLEELQRQIARAERQQQHFCVVFVDLDKFKAINDQYGHETGDDFLKEFASKLSRGLRKGDFVARQGGDEFVMICQLAEHSEMQRQELEQRIRQLCSGDFHLPKVTLMYEGPSIGIVIRHPGGSSDVDSLLSQADAAMYQDKQQRRQVSAQH